MDGELYWMPCDFTTEEWSENPVDTIEKAARLLMETSPVDNDGSWHAWDELQKDGFCWIRVRGWIKTKELITEESEKFEDYEPGQEWFKKTDVVSSVRIDLKYDVRPPVRA